MNYVFQRGETVTLALAAVAGDPAVVTGITAAMKRVASGRTGVDPNAPIAAIFDVTFVAAQGAEAAYWALSLSPATTTALPAGSYVADARLVVGGGVTITDTIGVVLRDAVMS
jgi:hypothetical protein